MLHAYFDDTWGAMDAIGPFACLLLFGGIPLIALCLIEHSYPGNACLAR
jgi:hypothetical protein